MNLFESLGIKVDDDLASFVKEKAKFKKLDPSLFDKLDQMLKLIPTLIDAKSRPLNGSALRGETPGPVLRPRTHRPLSENRVS